MAHDESVRARCRAMYVSGRGITVIAKRAGVSRATIQRWKRDEGWDDLRRANRELEVEARALAAEMARAARLTSDPQQAYAAMHAAQLAGLGEAPPINPDPADVVKAMLRVLANHGELGPLIRKHRKDVLELVTQELTQMEVAR